MEGGPPIFRQDGSCPALLEDPCPGFPYGAVTRCGAPFQTLPVPKTMATGLFRVRSPLLTESRLMSVPPATEMFQFTGFASCTYEFSTGYPCGWVAPFGDPGITDRSHLPRAFRSVPRPSSPLSAKASTRCPCFALDHRIAVTGDAAPPPRTGPNPVPVPATAESGGLYEDTSLGQASGQALLAPPSGASDAGAMPTGRQAPLRRQGLVRLGHITTLSSPFNQPRRGRPRRYRSIFSERRAALARGPPAPLGAARLHLSPAKLKLWQSCALGGGGERVRTDDLLLAKQALSQLSYTPRARDQKTALRHQNCLIPGDRS